MNATETYETYGQYKAGHSLWKYVSPVLIVLGTVGNVLSIIVLLRPRLRQSTTMFYLTCLSFGDLFTLYTGLLRYWIRETFDTDLRHLSSASCKTHTFLVYYSLDFTVWVLVSVTIDRCLSVTFPFKSKRICSLSRSRWVIGVILFVFCLKNLHFFWTIDLVHTWEYRCDGNTKEREHFLRYIWPWIDLATFCVLPFTIMIIGNAKIIYEMIISQRKLNAHNSGTSNLDKKFTSQVSCVDQSGISLQASITTRDTDTKPRHPMHQTSFPGNKPQRRISSLSAMLLTVNCVFLITTSPIQAFLIGEEYWFSNRTNEDIARYKLWWAVVNMLQYSNNAIHFFLYCLTGPRFRNELQSMFKRQNKIAIVNEPSHTEL